jgi:hypothetical protein
MDEIYELAGQDLNDLCDMLSLASVTKVSVTIDDGLKIKVNEGMWSLPLGKLVT